MHSLRSLRLLVGSLTIDRSQGSGPESLADTTTTLRSSPSPGAQGPETETDPLVNQLTGEQGASSSGSERSEPGSSETTATTIINNLSRGVQVPDAEIDPAINQFVKEQGISSAFILPDRDGNPDRVAITVESRKSALALLTRGKLTKRSLFITEQLTKRRGHMIYRLRGLRSKFSLIRMAVFSRNGFPAVRVGESRINLIKSEEDFEYLNSFLERSATAMSSGNADERRPTGTDEMRRMNSLVENTRQRSTNGVVSSDVRVNADDVDNANAV